MPRAKNPQPSSKKIGRQHAKFWASDKAEWGGFLNILMTENMKKEFAVWLQQNNEAIWPLAQDIMGEGGKISFSFDAMNDCFIVTLTGALCSDDNLRYATSSRAPDVFTSLALLVWKHLEYAGGDYVSQRDNTKTSSTFNFG